MLLTAVTSCNNPNILLLIALIDLKNKNKTRLCLVGVFRQQRKGNACKPELRAQIGETKKPSQPRQFWSSGASVSVMALSLLLLVLFAGLLLCFLFIIRLYIVVKNGSTRVSGNKAPVTVLAVVGSGNATYLRRLRASPGFMQGCFVS